MRWTRLSELTGRCRCWRDHREIRLIRFFVQHFQESNESALATAGDET